MVPIKNNKSFSVPYTLPLGRTVPPLARAVQLSCGLLCQGQYSVVAAFCTWKLLNTGAPLPPQGFYPNSHQRCGKELALSSADLFFWGGGVGNHLIESNILDINNRDAWYTLDIKSLHTHVKMSGFCDVNKWDQYNNFRTLSTFNVNQNLYN